MSDRITQIVMTAKRVVATDVDTWESAPFINASTQCLIAPLDLMWLADMARIGLMSVARGDD